MKRKAQMRSEHIEERNGGYYIAGTRISLDSVVYSFKRGNSPEQIQAEYPTLELSQITAAIAFYVNNQQPVDDYLLKKQREFEASAMPLSKADPDLWAKLERARHTTAIVEMGEPRNARLVSANLHW